MLTPKIFHGWYYLERLMRRETLMKKTILVEAVLYHHIGSSLQAIAYADQRQQNYFISKLQHQAIGVILNINLFALTSLELFIQS